MIDGDLAGRAALRAEQPDLERPISSGAPAGSSGLRSTPSQDRAADRAVVAIPAFNEEARIGSCLSALAVQRDETGAPLPAGSFEVLVFANNCTDATARVVHSLSECLPYPLVVIEAELSGERAHAGWARKCAMDAAAERLARPGPKSGVILTTDADSRAAPTWVAANVAALAAGVDAVAGYVDADAEEFFALGPAFGARGKAEDLYLSAIAEIYALCDPRPHDPWPNHRVASGASLAVTVSAYRAVGGMPALPLGEDAAFVRALERAGLRVRHAMAAAVFTSCRFDGRARGGAAETMRMRHADLGAACDAELEPAFAAWRRASWKGRLRELHAAGALATSTTWAGRLGVAPETASGIAQAASAVPFEHGWELVESASGRLRRGEALRPSDLPLQTQHARRIIRRIRASRDYTCVSRSSR